MSYSSKGIKCVFFEKMVKLPDVKNLTVRLICHCKEADTPKNGNSNYCLLYLVGGKEKINSVGLHPPCLVNIFFATLYVCLEYFSKIQNLRDFLPIV